MTPAHPTHPEAGTPTQPLVRPPVARIAAWIGAAALGAVVLCAAGGAAMGDDAAAAARAGLLAIGPVALGAAAGLGVLLCFGPRAPFYWAPITIGASVIRMVVALFAACAFYSSTYPAKGPFWAGILIALLAILAAETAAIRAFLISTYAPRPTPGAPMEPRVA